MTHDPPTTPDLADQLDEALSSAWAGDAARLDQLIASNSTADDVQDPQAHTSRRPTATLGTALQAAYVRLSQPAAPHWMPEIPGYEIQSELGRGGMGAVWLARQQKLGGRLVALKVLPHSFGLSPQLRNRFRAEAQAIAKLKHPHIVDVYDVIEAGGVHAYAMEWVEGSSLANIIERAKEGDTSRHGQGSSMAGVREALGVSEASPGSPTDRSYIVFVCRIGMAVARALAAVHRAGLIHRDVKPSNILLRRDGTPLLSDFGLARDLDSSIVTQPGTSGSGAFAGTASFAAPEQLRADGGELDGRADIYALGVTLYAALALRVPFQGKHHVEVLRQIQHGLATPLRKHNPKLPKDLQTIIAKAMEPDPERRYQTAHEMADDLERLLNLQPIKARPASATTRLIKMGQRHLGLLTAATAGGILALGIVALILTYFTGFPRWSKAHLDEARLALLDPEQSDTLFSALFFNEAGARGTPMSGEVAAAALSHYDAAARFAPFNEEVALERELVRLARDILMRENPSPVSFAQDSELPLTAAFAAYVHNGWIDRASKHAAPNFNEHQLKSASSRDLRSLGLLAMLCGNPSNAFAAWTALDRNTDTDALIEAYFGVAYLITEQYGRAYPRLRNASEAFPNVGYLRVYLADAATRCGDLEMARQWLDEARAMPRLDRLNGIKRVEAAWHAAAGHDDEARRLYDEIWAERINVVSFYQHAQFLESRGDIGDALRMYHHVVSLMPTAPAPRRRFVALMERWWNTLDDSERRRLDGEIADSHDDPKGIGALMRAYVESVQFLDGESPPGDRPRALKADQSGGAAP